MKNNEVGWGEEDKREKMFTSTRPEAIIVECGLNATHTTSKEWPT